MKLEKHRYIVFKVHSKKKISKRDFIRRIWKSIDDLFGCKGAADTGLWVVCFEENEKKGIIRCNLKSLKPVKAALIMITNMTRRVPMMIQILGVSGTIKTAKEKFY
ncbi:MAG: ribonuclease P [Candidatus Lokiarchaeota archaeon]|nr:ribonuclease P [Candidatus Lokiarchaeota archaeon]